MGKYFFQALTVKAKCLRLVDKKLAKSYVLLFFVLVLILTSSVSWFVNRHVVRSETNLLTFQSDSSLRVAKNKVTIPAFVLSEASSLDGRNIYFPLDASFSDDINNMFFREGNAGDKNVHYVYKDFQLDASSDDTPVYIKGYEIKVEEADLPHDADVNATYHDALDIDDTSGKPTAQHLPPDHCPIRLAFIADSAEQPIVIDPSAQVIDYVDHSQGAVSRIDDHGVPKTQATRLNCNWNSFSTYSYGNTPLFTVPGGQTLTVTLVIWLEGTLPDCDKYIGKKISVDIDIESSFSEMETITFYDDTPSDNEHSQPHWISADDTILACSYEDPFSTEWKTVMMTKDPQAYTWTAPIPRKVVTNISFYRLSKNTNTERQATIFHAWHTTENVNAWAKSQNWNLQTTRRVLDEDTGIYRNLLTYTAVGGNGYDPLTPAERLAPSIGYWR